MPCGLPWWFSSKESAYNAGDIGDGWFNPWVGKIPWRGNGDQYSAWRIAWTEEPGRLKSVGSQRVRSN